ncbi:MAG: hypothetical protein LBL48_09310 [Azoarcus sp.]|jgi:hypothetical protein|nr:hypothetical protein [Azoarcus sp.]
MEVDLRAQGIVDDAAAVFARLAELDDEQRIEAINALRRALRGWPTSSSKPNPPVHQSVLVCRRSSLAGRDASMHHRASV